jgi:hypothetical protein
MAVGNYVLDMGRQHSFAIPNGVLHPQANSAMVTARCWGLRLARNLQLARPNPSPRGLGGASILRLQCMLRRPQVGKHGLVTKQGSEECHGSAAVSGGVPPDLRDSSLWHCE